MTSTNIWIGVDFNLPYIDWEDMKTQQGNTNAKLFNFMINCAQDNFLTQVVNHGTRKGNILDLFFTNNPSLINWTTSIPPLTPQADHDIVFIDVNTQASIPKQKKPDRFIYTKADWESMRDELSTYQLPDTTVQEQWDDFENNLTAQMIKHIPKKPPKSPKHKPWITREIITLTHRRNRAYISWKREPTKAHHGKFLHLRNRCQAEVRSAHRQYTENIFNLDEPVEIDKTKATKRFWTYVKSKKKRHQQYSPPPRKWHTDLGC